WAKDWGGDDSDRAISVAGDSLGNICVVGRFMGTVDFDPGSAVETREGPAGGCVFVSMFNSGGYLGWVAAGSGGTQSVGNDVAFDTAGDVYVAGSSFYGKTDEDGDYVIYNMPSGNYTLVFLKAGFVKATKAVTVIALEGVGVADVELAVDPDYVEGVPDGGDTGPQGEQGDKGPFFTTVPTVDIVVSSETDTTANFTIRLSRTSNIHSIVVRRYENSSLEDYDKLGEISYSGGQVSANVFSSYTDAWIAVAVKDENGNVGRFSEA
ncbi:MAG: carboxypeptidase-like regulatory domain-containing protein, partial [Planctomycetes bacterium]|nr:carboxypeptidase-like regulatory domain-containing protein [Planctomycetota bacterium]